MLAALASGYHGPPELTFGRAFTSWTLDPWTAAAIVLLGGLYLLGGRRVRGSGGAGPAPAAAMFCGRGLGFCSISPTSFAPDYPPTALSPPSAPTLPPPPIA